jgi:hypothetical protein
MSKWIQKLIDLIRGKKRVAIQPTKPPAPEPAQPEPTPEPVAARVFRWIPEGDTVRVIVPVPHWQWSVTVTSPSVHHTAGLHPNTRGGGNPVPGGMEYVLQGSGESWRERSLAIDPRGGGAVVFFVNLNAPDPATGWTATHWVVPDPRNQVNVP